MSGDFFKSFSFKDASDMGAIDKIQSQKVTKKDIEGLLGANKVKFGKPFIDRFKPAFRDYVKIEIQTYNDPNTNKGINKVYVKRSDLEKKLGVKNEKGKLFGLFKSRFSAKTLADKAEGKIAADKYNKQLNFFKSNELFNKDEGFSPYRNNALHNGGMAIYKKIHPLETPSFSFAFKDSHSGGVKDFKIEYDPDNRKPFKIEGKNYSNLEAAMYNLGSEGQKMNFKNTYVLDALIAMASPENMPTITREFPEPFKLTKNNADDFIGAYKNTLKNFAIFNSGLFNPDLRNDKQLQKNLSENKPTVIFLPDPEKRDAFRIGHRMPDGAIFTANINLNDNGSFTMGGRTFASLEEFQKAFPSGRKGSTRATPPPRPAPNSTAPPGRGEVPEGNGARPAPKPSAVWPEAISGAWQFDESIVSDEGARNALVVKQFHERRGFPAVVYQDKSKAGTNDFKMAFYNEARKIEFKPIFFNQRDNKFIFEGKAYDTLDEVQKSTISPNRHAGFDKHAEEKTKHLAIDRVCDNMQFDEENNFKSIFRAILVKVQEKYPEKLEENLQFIRDNNKIFYQENLSSDLFLFSKQTDEELMSNSYKDITIYPQLIKNKTNNVTSFSNEFKVVCDINGQNIVKALVYDDKTKGYTMDGKAIAFKDVEDLRRQIVSQNKPPSTQAPKGTAPSSTQAPKGAAPQPNLQDDMRVIYSDKRFNMILDDISAKQKLSNIFVRDDRPVFYVYPKEGRRPFNGEFKIACLINGKVVIKELKYESKENFKKIIHHAKYEQEVNTTMYNCSLGEEKIRFENLEDLFYEIRATEAAPEKKQEGLTLSKALENLGYDAKQPTPAFAEIKSAHRKWLIVNHPDKLATKDPALLNANDPKKKAEWEKITANFQLHQGAYELIEKEHEQGRFA